MRVNFSSICPCWSAKDLQEERPVDVNSLTQNPAPPPLATPRIMIEVSPPESAALPEAPAADEKSAGSLSEKEPENDDNPLGGSFCQIDLSDLPAK